MDELRGGWHAATAKSTVLVPCVLKQAIPDSAHHHHTCLLHAQSTLLDISRQPCCTKQRKLLTDWQAHAARVAGCVSGTCLWVPGCAAGVAQPGWAVFMQPGPPEGAQGSTLSRLVQKLLIAQQRHRQPSRSRVRRHVLPEWQQQQQQGGGVVVRTAARVITVQQQHDARGRSAAPGNDTHIVATT